MSLVKFELLQPLAFFFFVSYIFAKVKATCYVCEIRTRFDKLAYIV